MNTWCTYVEYMEAMEKQLQKQIDLEKSVYFNWSCRSLSFKYDYIGSDGINLMQSINSKLTYCNTIQVTNPITLSYISRRVIAKHRISDNKAIMQRYAKI